MKRHLSYLLLFLLTPILRSTAQIATRISGTQNYGHLFTDGTTLYNITKDSVSLVNSTTGALSFLVKLPANPTGGTWDNTHIVKTATGFMLPQYYRTGGILNATKVWAYDGSAWDTVLTDYSATVVNGPLRIQNSFAFLFTNTGTSTTEIGRTDGTLAGSSKVYSGGIVTQANTFSGNLVFNGTSGSSFPSTYPKKLLLLSDASLSYLDSASAFCTPLGIVGNDVFYHYTHQSGTPGTPNLVTTNQLMKHTLSTHTNTVVTANLPAGTYYTDGTIYKNKIITQKVDSGRQTPNLVSINPASGAETYLTNNPTRTTSAQYLMQLHGAGTAHLYLTQLDTNGAQATFITDGSSLSSGRLYYSPVAAIPFIPENSFAPVNAIICGDEVYGGLYRRGTFSQELFQVNAMGQIDSQIIKPTVFGGSEPQNFVRVNGEIYFRTLDTFTYDAAFNRIDHFHLWKIAACSTASAVAQKATIPSVQASLYPNPAAEGFSVSLEGVSEAILQVYDATGRLMLHRKVHASDWIPAASFPQGIYLYRLTDNGNLLSTDRLLIAR